MRLPASNRPGKRKVSIFVMFFVKSGLHESQIKYLSVESSMIGNVSEKDKLNT